MNNLNTRLGDFKSRRSICLSKLALLLLLTSTSVLRGSAGITPELPLTQAVTPTTNTYHLSFAWDGVTNAIAYSLIVKTNGVEAWRVFTTDDHVTVSNLAPNLDEYQFTATASNTVGESVETSPAIKRLITIYERDSLDGPLRPFTTPVFEPTNSGRLFWPSNWNAASLLKKD